MSSIFIKLSSENPYKITIVKQQIKNYIQFKFPAICFSYYALSYKSDLHALDYFGNSEHCHIINLYETIIRKSLQDNNCEAKKSNIIFSQKFM